MKKIFLAITLMLLSFSIKAQNNVYEIHEINFYGVDFSLAKVFGMTESPTLIKSDLCSISDAFYNQKRFDFQRFLGKSVQNFNFEQTNKNNKNINESVLISTSPTNEITQEDIKKIINSLSCTNCDKTGLVIIAEMLDKTYMNGTFHFVFFNENSKEIIYSKKSSGKPSGFGIRNFWLGSIHRIIKTWRY